MLQELELQKRKKRQRVRRALTVVTFVVALCALMAVSAFADTATPTTLAGATFTDLIEDTFSSFSIVIKGLASGLKEAFLELIYVDAAATDPAFSPLVIFVFVMAGLGLATGILYKIFGMVQSRG